MSNDTIPVTTIEEIDQTREEVRSLVNKWLDAIDRSENKNHTFNVYFSAATTMVEYFHKLAKEEGLTVTRTESGTQ